MLAALLVLLLALALALADEQNLTCHYLSTVEGPGAGPWIYLSCIPSVPCNSSFYFQFPNATGCAITPFYDDGGTAINEWAGRTIACDGTVYISGGGSGGQWTGRCFCTNDTSDCASDSEYFAGYAASFATSPSQIPIVNDTIVWTWTSQAPNMTTTMTSTSPAATGLTTTAAPASMSSMNSSGTSNSGAGRCQPVIGLLIGPGIIGLAGVFALMSRLD